MGMLHHTTSCCEPVTLGVASHGGGWELRSGVSRGGGMSRACRQDEDDGAGGDIEVQCGWAVMSCTTLQSRSSASSLVSGGGSVASPILLRLWLG